MPDYIQAPMVDETSKQFQQALAQEFSITFERKALDISMTMVIALRGEIANLVSYLSFGSFSSFALFRCISPGKVAILPTTIVNEEYRKSAQYLPHVLTRALYICVAPYGSIVRSYQVGSQSQFRDHFASH
jgi:hypothetical protein